MAKSKPRVITTSKPLPFGALEPLEFERMCLWLVQAEGYLRPEHLGEAGGEQGRDVVAYKAVRDGEELWYFQCKRYARIGAAALKAEVDKINELVQRDPSARPVGMVFVTNATVSARTRESVESYCRKYGYASEFWAHTELDMKVKKYPRIVHEFFDALAGPPRESALHQLPAPPRDFTGREAEIKELLRELKKQGAIISCQGMGGVGKTALALVLAHRLADRYGDAQVFVDLHGADKQAPLSVADAMAHVIRAWNAEYKRPEEENQVRADYHAALHGKRVILLMDNARDRAQLEPLIPPETCILLVTTRQHFVLPRMYVRDLGQLPPEDARRLLLAIVPRAGDVVDDLARLCGYLPIALRLAGSALAERADLTPAEYVTRLTDAKARLGLIDGTLSLSYDLLDAEAGRRFGMLAVFPGTFDKEGAAAVWEARPEAAQDALGELIAYSLVEFDEGTRRYRLHDLARVFADSRLAEKDREGAQRRHAAHYLELLREADEQYLKGGENFLVGLGLFDLEWENIEAGQAWGAANASGDDALARLCSDYPDAGTYCIALRLHPREKIRWREAALAAARRLKDRPAEGLHLGNLGIAYAEVGETRRAIECYGHRLKIARETGDRHGEGHALGNLGKARAALGETRRAIECYEQALAIDREIGDRRGEGIALGNLGIAYAEVGETRRAIEYYEQRLKIAREIGDRRGEGSALGNLGSAYAHLGGTRRAIEYYEQALAIDREIGDRGGEGVDLWNIALALKKLGRTAEVISNAEAALAIFEAIEHPHAEMVRRGLQAWRKAKGGGK